LTYWDRISGSFILFWWEKVGESGKKWKY